MTVPANVDSSGGFSLFNSVHQVAFGCPDAFLSGTGVILFKKIFSDPPLMSPYLKFHFHCTVQACTNGHGSFFINMQMSVEIAWTRRIETAGDVVADAADEVAFVVLISAVTGIEVVVVFVVVVGGLVAVGGLVVVEGLVGVGGLIGLQGQRFS